MDKQELVRLAKNDVAMVALIATVTAVSIFAVTETTLSNAQSVFQGSGGDLGQSISDLTQGIIAGTNEQVQNTLESATNQAVPQLPTNASDYDCLVIVMNFGKAHGAMTCTPGMQLSKGVTVNSANAPGWPHTQANVGDASSQAQGLGQSSVQSSIQKQGGSTMMQNQIQGSGSSSNIIPGDVP